MSSLRHTMSIRKIYRNYMENRTHDVSDVRSDVCRDLEDEIPRSVDHALILLEEIHQWISEYAGQSLMYKEICLANCGHSCTRYQWQCLGVWHKTMRAQIHKETHDQKESQ